MRSSWIIAYAAILAALFASTETARQNTRARQPQTQQTAQPKIADGDWPHFNRDARSSRYSPLKQIASANGAELQQAWMYTPRRGDPPAVPAGQRGQRGGGGGVGNEVVPIVINGVMYVPAGNLVVGVKADS